MHERRARFAIGTLFLINGFAFATWVSRIPAVQESLALSAGTLGAALAGLGIGSFVAMPLTGWLIARFGSRPVTSLATAGCCAAVILPSLASSALALGAALVAFGAVMGAMDVAMNAQGVELEHRYDSPIMSTFHALFSVGGMLGASAGGAIASRHVDVFTHFVVVAVILAGGSALAFPSLLTAPAQSAERASHRLRFSAAFVGLSVLAMCIMVSEGAMADWTPVYLGLVLGTGPGLAAAGYAVFSAAMTAGRLAGDRLTVRFGRVTLVRAGALLAAVGLTAALALESVPAALVGFLSRWRRILGDHPARLFRGRTARRPICRPGTRGRDDRRLSRFSRRPGGHRVRGRTIHAAARAWHRRGSVGRWRDAGAFCQNRPVNHPSGIDRWLIMMFQSADIDA